MSRHEKYRPVDYIDRIKSRPMTTRYERVAETAKAILCGAVIVGGLVWGIWYMADHAARADAAVVHAPICDMTTNTAGFCTR